MTFITKWLDKKDAQGIYYESMIIILEKIRNYNKMSDGLVTIGISHKKAFFAIRNHIRPLQ